MAEAPVIRPQVRVKHARTSITVPHDVDEWVRWRSATAHVSMSSVYAEAVRIYADLVAKEDALVREAS